MGAYFFSSLTTSRTASIALPTPLRTRPSAFSALPSVFEMLAAESFPSLFFNRAGGLFQATFDPLPVHAIPSF